VLKEHISWISTPVSFSQLYFSPFFFPKAFFSHPPLVAAVTGESDKQYLSVYFTNSAPKLATLHFSNPQKCDKSLP